MPGRSLCRSVAWMEGPVSPREGRDTRSTGEFLPRRPPGPAIARAARTICGMPDLAGESVLPVALRILESGDTHEQVEAIERLLLYRELVRFPEAVARRIGSAIAPLIESPGPSTR